jgi:hypothetical protein
MSYMVTARSTIVTAAVNAPLWTLRAPTRRCYAFEITLSTLTAPATSGAIGFLRSTALASGTLTTVTGQPVQPEGSAGTVQLVTAWTTAPTINTANYLGRIAVAPSIGNVVVVPFPPDHPLEATGGGTATSEIVFTNLNATAPGTYEIIIRYLE